MARERVVYVPVIRGGAGGGVGAMFGLILAVIAVAVLVAVVVEMAYPTPKFVQPTTCEPFCSQYSPASTSAVGGEQR